MRGGTATWGLSLLLWLCAVEALGADAPSRRPLAPDDIYRVQTLSDPQVSPDGGWVAYVVTSNDRDADEQRSAVWMVSWDGRQQLALTAAGKKTSKPRWSPDGRYLAFLATPPGSDEAQIMLLDRRGGDARPLTSVAGDISEYAWSPDGRRIVLAMEQGGGTGKVARPIVIEAMHFKSDEEGYFGIGQAHHLYLIDVDGQRLETLTSDANYNEDRPIFSPDGKHVLFTRTRDRGGDQDGLFDLEIMDAAPGANARRLVHAFAPNAQRLAFSPDGTTIGYLEGLAPKFNAYMQDHLAVVPASGGASRDLSEKLDRAVSSFVFTGAKTLAITVEDDGIAYPAHIETAGGKVTRDLPMRRSVASAVSSQAGHTALLDATDETLNEVYALEGGKLRRLTHHNDAFLSQLRLGEVEDVQFKSKDGADIHGLLVKPADFQSGRKYPLVLWIHGGPNGQDEHALALDGYQFEHQMFAARGFLVLRVNYRGSSGRGAAFAQAILADWGHKEVEDLLAGVDFAIARGLADADRLAIGGWSYGGILTDYAIATDGRFKAAISGAGSANQITTYGTDQYVMQYNNELGPPWRDPDLWIKLSYPFFHADRIRTPTLFLGGEKDFNVPISGGEQLYQALKTLGIPAQLVVYPEQHHVFTRPSFVKDLAERMSGWLDRYDPPKP